MQLALSISDLPYTACVGFNSIQSVPVVVYPVAERISTVFCLPGTLCAEKHVSAAVKVDAAEFNGIVFTGLAKLPVINIILIDIKIQPYEA